MRHVLVYGLLFALGGCAMSPPISEVRGDLGKVELIQLRSEPMSYALGVVDARSFWAEYGDDVAGNLGGSMLAQGVHANASKAEQERRPSTAELARSLAAGYPMTANLTRSLLPQVAAKWGVNFRSDRMRVVEDGMPAVGDGYLHGYEGDADTVLASYLWFLKFTEKPTIGGALKAGFTLGTNVKHVTAEVAWHSAAYKRQPDGRYKEVWRHVCWVPAAQNNQSVPFPELLKNPTQAQALLQDADEVAREFCTKRIAALQ